MGCDADREHRTHLPDACAIGSRTRHARARARTPVPGSSAEEDHNYQGDRSAHRDRGGVLPNPHRRPQAAHPDNILGARHDVGEPERPAHSESPLIDCNVNLLI